MHYLVYGVLSCSVGWYIGATIAGIIMDLTRTYKETYNNHLGGAIIFMLW